jgi:hypothetical protein
MTARPEREHEPQPHADGPGHGGDLRSKKDTSMDDNTVAALADAFWTAVRREQAMRSPQCPNDVLDALTLTLARMIAKYAVYLETGGVRVDVPQTVEAIVQQLRAYPYAQAIEAGRNLSVTIE